MNLIKTVTIRNPDQSFTFEQVESVSVVTSKGPLIIYSKHASLTGTIAFSILRVKHGSTIESLMVRNGLLFINNDQNSVVILASTIELLAEVSMETIESYLAKVKEQLENGQDLLPIQFKYLENERLTLIEQLTVLRKK
jgi:F0F1-type ATP synthase epsilon subunit